MVNKPKVPIYSLPDPDLNFLASCSGLFDYGHLYAYALQFKKITEEHLPNKKTVIFLSESSDSLCFAIASCWLLGIPFTTLTPNQSDTELQSVLTRLKAKTVFTDKKNSSRVEHFQQLLIPEPDLELVSYKIPESIIDHPPEGLLGTFATSGSTGTPKLVPLKRKQILFAAKASEENFRPDSNRYWLLCLPLNHVGGISIIIRSILYHSAIYRMDRFDEHQVATFMDENKLFQVASLVPTMLHCLLENPQFKTHKEFKTILLGGGPISQALLKKANIRGVPVVSSYGMTETCAQIAANPLTKPSGLYIPVKSVGTVFSPNQAEIRSDSGNTLSANNSGTIWLKGPQVFEGYTDKADNNGKFDKEGWFNTGDYGHMNATGQLFIETRRTDLIISGGENINPREVESALEEITNVGQAAVIGAPDEKWGQRVVAFIEPTTGEKPNAEKILEEVKRKLPGFKVPKEIILSDALPRTESGKIKKSVLLKMITETNGSGSSGH
jgi:O-succinylbenzoic acid--CoA ligase